MVKQNREIYFLKNQLSVSSDQSQLSERLTKKYWMIIGEGTVFLGLMILGILRVRSSFKKEVALADQQKNFILSITHELKSPIASAKLQLETLLKHDLLPKEKQQQLLNNALGDTERLDHLVENILLAANIENSNYSIYPSTTDITALTKLIIDDYEKRTNQPIHFRSSTFPTNATVDIDAYTSILINLIENAVKYSNSQEVKVELLKETDGVSLFVSDKGPGIAEHEKENIFKKFYRIGSEQTRKTRGTGLGLYIVKHLTDLHSAKIKVKNNEPQGTIFQIKFYEKK